MSSVISEGSHLDLAYSVYVYEFHGMYHGFWSHYESTDDLFEAEQLMNNRQRNGYKVKIEANNA